MRLVDLSEDVWRVFEFSESKLQIEGSTTFAQDPIGEWGIATGRKTKLQWGFGVYVFSRCKLVGWGGVGGRAYASGGVFSTIASLLLGVKLGDFIFCRKTLQPMSLEIFFKNNNNKKLVFRWGIPNGSGATKPHSQTWDSQREPTEGHGGPRKPKEAHGI